MRSAGRWQEEFTGNDFPILFHKLFPLLAQRLQCMNLDVADGVMNDSMNAQMALSTPEDEVSNLMQVGHRLVMVGLLATAIPFKAAFSAQQRCY